MSGVNRVILVGNLGADPELKRLESGRARVTFRIATTDGYKDKSGERIERTEWHRIVAWGRTAEVAGEYLQKGRQVCVQGKLQTRRWSDNDGRERFTTEVVADHVTFLSGGQKRELSQAA